ncbi:uncharacterized protein LOC113075904 isoform X2 [Carassius auratus]|uniref:Uncharacterized protein LOC113075904 isoform X2 n=1 Tax=Carassius auratus TaxID=7957 RepID=A0A6P6N7C7_CARAU|nr:uncharacterized protein LOC113075904 isoform X2 [Carassius auratus]
MRDLCDLCRRFGSLTHHAESRENPVTPAALMPGDDAALLTPGRMSQRGKEAGLHTPSKDLLTSPSLSPGVSYSHAPQPRPLQGESTLQTPS